MDDAVMRGQLLRERMVIDIAEECRLHEVLLPQTDLTDPPTEWPPKDEEETSEVLREWVRDGLVALYWDHEHGYPPLTEQEAARALKDPRQWHIENPAVLTARLIFTDLGDERLSPFGRTTP